MLRVTYTTITHIILLLESEFYDGYANLKHSCRHTDDFKNKNAQNAVYAKYLLKIYFRWKL